MEVDDLDSGDERVSQAETAESKAVKVPVMEVPLTEEQLARIAEIDAFLIEHSVKVNRKKKKLLTGLPVGPYETYKLGVIVANCCKVFG